MSNCLVMQSNAMLLLAPLYCPPLAFEPRSFFSRRQQMLQQTMLSQHRASTEPHMTPTVSRLDHPPLVQSGHLESCQDCIVHVKHLKTVEAVIRSTRARYLRQCT